MTNLTVHTGLIRFHFNLRDSSRSSLPVAAFSLCELNGAVFGALVVALPAELSALSPAARRMLRLMPATVQLQIDRLLREEGGCELGDFMRKLQASFMNSIFVEQVLLDQPLSASAGDAPGAVVRHTVGILQEAQRGYREGLAESADAPGHSPVAPLRIERPESKTWWPRRCGDQVRVAAGL